MIQLIFLREQIEKLQLAAGLEALQQEYGFTAQYAGDGLAVFLRDTASPELLVTADAAGAELAFDFTRRNHFFRCLGLLLEALSGGQQNVSIREEAWFRHNGPMLDLSQGNAVIRVEAMKGLMRKMAMMGLNQCLLYMEDSFDVPGEPYFGYMRSRYSYEELKALDDYGFSLGIEMIPAVQSLAHYEEVLKWDVYLELRESVECLVPEQEETYAFLRRVFEAASKPFRTKRINLCMDEAHGLGLGVYLKRHGLVDTQEILRKHLERVLEIAREMGLRPMIADDMFHRPFGTKKRASTVIPKEYCDSLPKDFDILCWDYYMTDPVNFAALVDRDRQLAPHVVFEGGIWTWVGFAPHWDKTVLTTNMALEICKQKGVDDIQATVWGDTGTECDVRMILWGLQLFAEHGFQRGTPADDQLRRRFRFCTGGDWDLFFKTQDFDKIPGIPADAVYKHGSTQERMPSKFLLWQDLLYGMFDENIRGLPLNRHYEALKEAYACVEAGEYATIFRLYYQLAEVLSIKSELGIQIHDAYAADDRVTLRMIAREVLPELLEKVQRLEKTHRKCWLEVYKPIGWEVIGLRYGGLRSRIEYAIDALEDYLTGIRLRLEEVEEKQLPFNGEEGIPRYTNGFGRIYSASRIANSVHLGFPKK